MSYLKSYSQNCFRHHIEESIGINRERKIIYSSMTAGQSDRIFNTLIASEVISIIPATYFDYRAKKFQKKGLELFQHEFMSMNRAGLFDPNEKVTVTGKIKEFDWKFYKIRLDNAIHLHNHETVRSICVEALVELKAYPQYYCMMRHLIESIYRFAFFVPIRVKQASTLKIDSPESLMFDVMKLHLLGFEGVYKIDLWCQPIQQSGILILNTELPDLLLDLDAEEIKPLKLNK